MPSNNPTGENQHTKRVGDNKSPAKKSSSGGGNRSGGSKSGSGGGGKTGGSKR